MSFRLQLFWNIHHNPLPHMHLKDHYRYKHFHTLNICRLIDTLYWLIRYVVKHPNIEFFTCIGSFSREWVIIFIMLHLPWHVISDYRVSSEGSPRILLDLIDTCNILNPSNLQCQYWNKWVSGSFQDTPPLHMLRHPCSPHAQTPSLILRLRHPCLPHAQIPLFTSCSHTPPHLMLRHPCSFHAQTALLTSH